MDRIREQFSRKSGVRRDTKSDEVVKASVASSSSAEQPEQIQEITVDEDLYGLKELWPGELRGFETKIE
jgi:putative sterol carrier protein